MTAFGLTRHQYYYRPKANGEGCLSRPGAKPSTHTDHFDAEGNLSRRTNDEVVDKIKDVQADDDLRCGYKRMGAQLELQGYRINNKKTYRLMKEEDLLLDRRRSERGPYVTHRCARPDKPLTLLEMDIKMFWVEEYRRHAFVLTIIDTFWTLKQLEIRLAIFYEKYNNSRVHSAVAMLPPQLFWEAWGKEKITARKNKRGKLIFKLTVPRYLLTHTLKLEAEVPANEQANTKPAAPQANAPKQQNTTPAVC